MLAAITKSRARVRRLVGFVLIDWLALLVLSFPFIHAPPLAIPALLAIGLPLIGLSGAALWRYASYNASELAYRDDLTGLGNRRAFKSLGEKLLQVAKSGTLSMILLDVDQLKAINDDCGHQAGDELLSTVADHLRETAPDSGLVFRFGGDEFALLIDRSRGVAATEVISRLGPFASVLKTCGHAHAIGISHGFASNILGETFDSLFRRADQRLREQKRRLYNAGEIQDRWEKDSAGRAGAEPLEDKISSLDERRQRRRPGLRP